MDENGLAPRLADDLQKMSDIIRAKREILRQVYCSLRDTSLPSSGRQLIKEVLNTEPRESLAPESRVECELTWTIGWQDTVCAAVQVRNTSSQCELVVSCLAIPMAGVLKSAVFNEEGRFQRSIRPDESSTLLVCLPSCSFMRDDPPTVIVDCRWTLPGRVDSRLSVLSCDVTMCHPCESHPVRLPQPQHWKTLNDLPSCEQKESSLLLLCAQTSMLSHAVPPISMYEFRLRHDSFDCCDYGEWQIHVGTGRYNGLLALSQDQECGVVDTIYAVSSDKLKSFIEFNTAKTTK